MPNLQVQVRVGSKRKTIVLDGRRISIGRSRASSLVLPFDWVQERHLVVENTDQAMRIKLGAPDAEARMAGRALTTKWVALPSPAQVQIPAPGGKTLLLDIACTQAGAEILRSAGGSSDDLAAPEEDLGVRMASADGMAKGGWAAGDFPGGRGSAAGESPVEFAPLPPPGLLLRSPGLTIAAYAGFFVVLILASLGFNQYRRSVERTRLNEDVAFVGEHLQQAHSMLGKKQYAAAKAALDAAEPVARGRPNLSEAAKEIGRLRQKPEIRLGALGYVEVDGQWLPKDTAAAWRAARERDDPKIARLEEDGANALNQKRYEQARVAYEQAVALMESHPVKPHPRLAPVKAQLQLIKDEAKAAEMTAKGYVRHEDRWVTKEEKLALEQQAKGLIEFQGKWMTRQEVAAAQAKGGTGMVFHDGKWMTPEQKMAAEGYVQFEGEWMRPERMKQIEDDRRKEADRAKEEQAKLETVKQSAYTASQQFVRKQLTASKKVEFQAYGGADVRVVVDEGWFIVKAVVDVPEGAATQKRTYYCKLKPGEGDAWQVESIFFAN